MNPSTLPRFIRYAFIFIAVITFFSTLVYISQSEVKEWDESRNGINAFEMLQRGSWLVPYFEGEVDTWNAKPPLFHWCIMLSYKLFGMNTFSMRLPSLLATIGFFFVFYHFMLLLVNAQLAQLACIILLTCKAVLGDHIGLTADFDSLLLLFLMISVYFSGRYRQTGNRLSLVWASVFTGLAFWTKGAAGLLLLPSLTAYLVFSRKKGDENVPLKFKDGFMALGLLALFILAWTLVSVMYIRYSTSGMYGSSSQLETMWVHDLINRLFIDDSRQFTSGRKWHFFFAAIETRMQLWGILFFTMMVGMILYRKPLWDNKEKDLLRLSALVIFPIGLLLTISKNQHNWYLAPVYPFIAVVLAVWFGRLIRHRAVPLVLLLLIGIQSTRQNHFLLTDRDAMPVSAGFEEMVDGTTIYYMQIPQDVLLKLVFMGAMPVKWKEESSVKLDNRSLWLMDKSSSHLSIGSIGRFQLVE